MLAFYADPEPYPGEDLERELKSRFDSVTTLRADTRFVNAAGLKLPSPDSYDVAILALFVRVSDRKGNVDIPAEQAALAEQVYKTGKPVITVGFGSPYLIERFPQAETWLAAFGISDVAQISIARALFGQIPVRGHVPVTIPGVNLKAGSGIELPAAPMTLQPADVRAEAILQPAFDVIEHAVADKAFPGATLAVGYKGKVSLHAFGNLSYEAELSRGRTRARCTTSRRSRKSSLPRRWSQNSSKATSQFRSISTPKSIAIFRSGPPSAPGEPPQQIEWRHRVTVRHLLTHTSGLPPFKEYWRTSTGKQDTLTRIFAEPLDYEPGTKEVYSDLGIILMATIVERLTGRTLDDLAKTYIFSPLGMKDTTYKPDKKLWPWIAPTEFDKNLRHRLVQGEVHDENAFTIGGVSGHAGVFSTAPDLAAFCQMLLNGGVYAHRRILKRATIAQFTAPQQLSNGTRTLGWAVPTEGGSSGHFFSAHSFGHTGFTGTSIWIDPDRQLFVVLLTNRVNPTRENMKIAQVRPALHDAVMQALGFATVPTPASH